MASPLFQVMPARSDQVDAIRALLQLYQYDLAEISAGALEEDGRFHFVLDPVEWWQQPGARASLLHVLDQRNAPTPVWRPAGFALMRNHSHLARGPEPDQWVIDQFFVLRQHRRAGEDSTLARHCFDTIHGRWQVAELAPNTAAQAFWRRVIGAYTGGRFVELELDDERWRGPIQTFDNSLMVG